MSKLTDLRSNPLVPWWVRDAASRIDGQVDPVDAANVLEVVDAQRYNVAQLYVLVMDGATPNWTVQLVRAYLMSALPEPIDSVEGLRRYVVEPGVMPAPAAGMAHWISELAGAARERCDFTMWDPGRILAEAEPATMNLTVNGQVVFNRSGPYWRIDNLDEADIDIDRPFALVRDEQAARQIVEALNANQKQLPLSDQVQELFRKLEGTAE